MYSFEAVARAAPHAYLRFPASRVATRTSQSWKRNITTKNDVSKQMVEKLPLAGIKVLDMTRVLAGVCDPLSKVGLGSLTSRSHIVLRYSEILG
jgi:hypothetical protein